MWWFCCLLGALKNKTDSRIKLFLNEAYMIFPVLTLQWAQTASPQSADVGFQMCLQSAKASPCCWGPGQSPLHHPGSWGTGWLQLSHTANLGRGHSTPGKVSTQWHLVSLHLDMLNFTGDAQAGQESCSLTSSGRGAAVLTGPVISH